VLSSSDGAGTAIGLGLGGNHTCVIRASDSSLVCFGGNRFNQLGYGAAVSRYLRVVFSMASRAHQSRFYNYHWSFISGFLLAYVVLVAALARLQMCRLQSTLLILEGARHQMLVAGFDILVFCWTGVMLLLQSSVLGKTASISW
jgi:hypothetical protein